MTLSNIMLIVLVGIFFVDTIFNGVTLRIETN